MDVLSGQQFRRGRPLPASMRRTSVTGVAYHFDPAAGDNTVLAHHEGRVVGRLEWAHDGEINGVYVEPEYQRRGVASGMLAHARRIDPGVRHSDNLTADGRGWAQATEY